MEKTAIIIDVAIPGNKRIIDKEKEKIEKYQNFKREFLRLCILKKIDVIPVVLGDLGNVTKNFEKYVGKIGIKVNLHTVQKTTLLGTARSNHHTKLLKYNKTILNKSTKIVTGLEKLCWKDLMK